jgi:HEAT repeat protein/lysophospholipase L1-like esterase
MPTGPPRAGGSTPLNRAPGISPPAASPISRARPRLSHRAGALLVNVSLSAAVTAGAIGAAEAVARRFERPAAPRVPADTRGTDWRAEWQDDFYVMKSTGVGWPPWEDFNRDGLRDRPHPLEKPERTYRLVCLGDSVTLGYGFSRGEAWPQVLEELVAARGPRLEVFNVALLGWSTRQERYAYERIARRYRPDGVVLAIVLNDLGDLQNNLARPPRLLADLFRRSALARWVMNPEGREIESVDDLFVHPEPLKVASAYARLFAEVRRLRDEVRADGATLTLMVLPEADQVRPDPHPSLPQERIAAFARAEELPLVDPLPALRAVGAAAYMDRLHLTPAGSALVAETVLASGAIPPAAYTTEPLRASLASAGGSADHENAPVAALAELVARGPAPARRAAAWALGRRGPQAITALPALTAALHDVDPAVRAESARAVAALGPAAAAATADLFALLEDRREHVRWAAAGALHAIAPAARDNLARLVHALDSGDPYVRAFAAWTLGLAGPDAVSAGPALEARLHDPDPGIRTLAVRALGNLRSGDTAAVAGLADVVLRGTGDSRWRAARALAKLGPSAAAATPALARALSDPDDKLRRESAFALALIGPGAEAALPALVAAERDPVPDVREAAHKAIRRITATTQ